jgi:hypothetical protein
VLKRASVLSVFSLFVSGEYSIVGGIFLVKVQSIRAGFFGSQPLSL